MDQAEDVFANYLHTNGLRMTGQRRAIFRAFYQANRHLTAEEIYNLTRSVYRNVGMATVWRNMKLIKEAGLAEEHRFGDGLVRYERRSPESHGHMVCTECGRPVEFDTTKIMSFLDEVADVNYFQVNDYRVEIYGRCFLCRAGETESSKTRGEH
jgi:Fur family ferric uptake transcriptional regulator